MMTSSSVGLTPAAGSSSRMAVGIGHQDAGQFQQLALAAGEHARRLVLEPRQRDEVEQRARLLDRRPLLPPRHGRASGSSSRCPRRPGAAPPVSTFSSTVISAKGCGIWKVRPTPQRDAPLRRPRRDTSRPATRIAPRVGFRLPASRLNSVVLPAPFGPISPSISPRPSAIDMPSTARKPPNRLASSRASTTGAPLAALVVAGRGSVSHSVRPNLDR